LNRICSLLISIFLLTALTGCRKAENPVLEYFENVELQYEGKSQEENIIAALNDILNLSESELRTRKYKDYTGKDNQWDLPTLISSHFVPDKSVSLGNNFYHDVKTNEMQKKIKQILEQMRKSPGE